RYTVDGKRSTIQWTGSKVTGSSHTGYISLSSGTVEVKENKITSAKMTADMTSITNTDLDAEYAAKLIGHLQSPDFFNVKEHNQSHFVLKSFTENERGGNTVTGTLTIKGISNEITFPARVAVKGDQVVIDANLTFDRAKYDVRYGSGSFFDDLGDNMISDEVELTMHIEAAKK
ncbi:MAG: YceI family protein, partial [Flavobacteriales bacterium]|nr:YceI family protein [Flavobacteriales bacterium]